MRDLVFGVNKQLLFKNPKCNFENIIMGSSNYLRCIFNYDSDWGGCKKVAVFTYKDKEFPVLVKNGCCLIPDDVLDKELFGLYLVGQRDTRRFRTNEVEIEQEGGSIWQQ